jgi:mycothiol synthase
MNFTLRAFSNENDLAAMRRLLMSGRQAANGTYYVHAGDVTWWYSYYTPGLDPRAFTTLWESEDVPGGLAAWALYSPAWYTLDVFVHPLLRGTPAAEAIWLEAEERSTSQRKPDGKKKLCTIWIAENDAWTIAHLQQRGFTRTEGYMDVMVRSLGDDVPVPPLSEGYTMRAPRDESEAPLRAAPQHAAFESDLPLEAYNARYASFMRNWGYSQGIDTMIVSPDRRGAAFCIAWPDPINRIGLLEPAGVHPDFHRQGLGRTIVLESFRKLRDCGMGSVMVCGLSDLPQACAFYASLGMQPVLRLCTYQKNL